MSMETGGGGGGSSLPTHHRHVAAKATKPQHQQDHALDNSKHHKPNTNTISPQTSFDYHQSSASSSPPQHHYQSHQVYYSSQFLMGLNIASVGSSILQTVYGLFYVDVFLFAYKLPIQSYSNGNIIFAFVNTANDVLGAYFLDSYAASYHHISRSDTIGVIGVLFSMMFLLPFFRWNQLFPGQSLSDFFHFVTSVSVYDTMYSLTAILLGSLVTDNHTMTDSERIWFMASSKIVNLLAAFVVTRIGLALFDINYLLPFQIYLVCVAVIVALLFLLAQIMTRYTLVWPTRQIKKKWFWKGDRGFFNGIRLVDTKKREDDAIDHDLTEHTKKARTNKRKLRLKQVLQDFWNHSNFWAWIGMELFLESQVSFCYAFLKTFMDRLIYDLEKDYNDRNDDNTSEKGYSRETCDWLLSMIRPMGMIMAILCYLPIRRFGYPKLYRILFLVNATLSVIMLAFADHTSTNLILMFLIIYPTITFAVMSSGFHLAMSDMVLEMKKRHTIVEGRYDEPSLAGLFMGINALFCKPAESILPVIAAHMLGEVKIDDFIHGASSKVTEAEELEDIQRVLFQVLVIPPFVFSIIQYLSWSRYTLTPKQTSQMREELKMHQHHYKTSQHQNQTQGHLTTVPATSRRSSRADHHLEHDIL